MKHIKLGGLEVGRIGLGAMGMSAYYTMGESNEVESIRTLHRATELGVTLIDTAEVYGPFINEELVGKALKGKRQQVILATKFGLISHSNNGANELDSKPSNIRTAVEGSLNVYKLIISTFSTSTGLTRTRLLKKRLELLPIWLVKARLGISVYLRPAPLHLGVHMQSIPLLRCKVNIPYGSVIRKRKYCLCCGGWA
jgi:hypothetical protein